MIKNDLQWFVSSCCLLWIVNYHLSSPTMVWWGVAFLDGSTPCQRNLTFVTFANLLAYITPRTSCPSKVQESILQWEFQHWWRADLQPSHFKIHFLVHHDIGRRGSQWSFQEPGRRDKSTWLLEHVRAHAADEWALQRGLQAGQRSSGGHRLCEAGQCCLKLLYISRVTLF